LLIDTHAHLYLNAFDADRDAVIERARAAGVEAIILPAIDVGSVHEALDLCGRYPGFCYAMAGLHPSYVREADAEEFAEVVTLAARPEIVAIGESGIDYYWDVSYNATQHDFLHRHAELAIESDLPLVLHNRDRQGKDGASHTLVDILSRVKTTHPHGDRLKGVFHCFGPPRWLADEVMRLGFHVGIGGSVTFKNGGVPEAVEAIPLERIVLETDAPYLAPVPHRGKRNEPAYVRLVAERLAEVRGLSVDEVARVTTATARTLFRL
jgi:TatD DNase family protein